MNSNAKKLGAIYCRVLSPGLHFPPCENRPLQKKISCQFRKWILLSIHLIARSCSPLSARAILPLFCQASCIVRSIGFLRAVFIASLLLPTHPPLHSLPSLLVRHDYMLFGLIPFRLLCCIILNLCVA